MSDNIETTETEQIEAEEGVQNPHTPEEEPTTEQEPDTFPRDYVEKLRSEAAKYRDRAKGADELRSALWQARVEATGRLADPTDLPMPEGADPLDAETVTTAVEALLQTKPHLASRRIVGAVGQGETASTTTTDLAGMLRARA